MYIDTEDCGPHLNGTEIEIVTTHTDGSQRVRTGNPIWRIPLYGDETEVIVSPARPKSWFTQESGTS